MKDLTKDDFSCWGNGDKYDDELFISHDPKFTAVEIADKILKNQEELKEFHKVFPRKLSDITPIEIIKCAEDAHSRTYELYMKNYKIVEKIKKIIEHGLAEDGFDDLPEDMCINIQKILDSKK